MAIIRGIEGLSARDVREALDHGAKFVVFEYCVSLLVITLRRSSGIHFIRPGEGTFDRSFRYNLVSLFLGWWGIPWGIIWTPMAIIKNVSGGRDVTAAILAVLQEEAAGTASPLPSVGAAATPVTGK